MSAGDIYWSSVKLLVHFDGTDGSTTFTDTSTSGRTLTAQGDAQVDTAQSQWGGASGLFDGTGDYISSAISSDFAFPGDFTIEFWARKTANAPGSYDCVATTDTSNGSASNGWIVELSSTRGFVFAYGGAVIVSYATNPNDSTWHHWAITRSGSTVRMFRDGTQVASATNSSSYLANGAFGIGRNVNYIAAYNGHIDDFRITKGVARYTGSFTAPTEAFPDQAAGIVAGLNAAPTFGTPLAIADRVETATGFASTVFGIPAIPLVATGINAAPTFGTAVGSEQFPATGINAAPTFGTPELAKTALGFTGTTFGTPLAIYDQFVDASGFQTGSFGTPVVVSICVASSLGPVATISPAYYAFNQTLEASGSQFGSRGRPVAFKYIIDLDVVQRPDSLPRTTRIGSPTAVITFTGVATALGPVSMIGSPGSNALGVTKAATGLASTLQAGTPSARLSQEADARAPGASFGTAAAACRVHPSGGLARLPRFGTPSATRAHSYITYGINLGGRFGHHQALRRNNRPATGFTGTTFGSPVAKQRHRVTSLAPVVQFGEPVRRFLPRAAGSNPSTTFGTPEAS